MKKLRTVLLSSVLALGLGQAAHAVYTQTDLVELRLLIESGDTDAILAFINANPKLMEGIDPLAEALREFTVTQQTFFGRVFGASVPNLESIPNLPEGVSSETVFASGSLSGFGS